MAHNKDFYGDGRTGNGGNIGNSMRALFTDSRMDPDLQRQLVSLVQMFSREVARLETKIETLQRSIPTETGLRPTKPGTAGRPLISSGDGTYFERELFGNVAAGPVSFSLDLAGGGASIACEVVNGVFTSIEDIP